jgi:hypothetical protein
MISCLGDSNKTAQKRQMKFLKKILSVAVQIVISEATLNLNNCSSCRRAFSGDVA